MSAIDTVPHRQLARICAIPLYWPTDAVCSPDLVQEVQGNQWANRSVRAIGPHTVLLGGGSGEHPALLVHINEAIERFVTELSFWPELHDEYRIADAYSQAQDFELFLAQAEELSEHIDVDPGFFIGKPAQYRLDLNHWPLETWIKIAPYFCGNSTATKALLGGCTDPVQEQLLIAVGCVLACLHVYGEPGIFKAFLHPKLEVMLQSLGPRLLSNLHPWPIASWV